MTTERYHPSLLIAGLAIATFAFMSKDFYIQIWGGVVILTCVLAFLTCTSTHTTLK